LTSPFGAACSGCSLAESGPISAGGKQGVGPRTSARRSRKPGAPPPGSETAGHVRLLETPAALGSRARPSRHDNRWSVYERIAPRENRRSLRDERCLRAPLRMAWRTAGARKSRRARPPDGAGHMITAPAEKKRTDGVGRRNVTPGLVRRGWSLRLGLFWWRGSTALSGFAGSPPAER